MDRFERQRQIFGDKGQERLRVSSIGIVGCGGLGSFVAMELAYLGVGRVVMIDHDGLEESNRNRLVGSWESHELGTPKVQIASDLCRLIDAEIEVEALEHRLEEQEAKAALTGLDVVVGCLDNDGPRFVLNEICCRLGLPLIDAGSDTRSGGDGIEFGGRVCVATPRTGCLMCMGVLDQLEIQDYFASADQQTDRATLYGVPKTSLAAGGPSVVTVNGVVASIAATELMALVARIHPPIAHQSWRGHKGQLFRVGDREDDCYYCALRPESVVATNVNGPLLDGGRDPLGTA